MKLKQVDPELLCQEPDLAENTQGDQTDITGPAQPSPFRGKPDATTSCHTYLFPQMRMDCSKRGKSAQILCFCHLYGSTAPSSKHTTHTFPMQQRR